MIRTCASLFLAAALLSQTATTPQNPIVGDPSHPVPITGWWNPWHDSEGFALGSMAVEKSGHFYQTLEGQLKLGLYSGRGVASPQVCRGEDCTAGRPLRFSNFNSRLKDVIRKLYLRFAVIRYNSYIWLPFLGSDNYLVKIYPIDPDLLKIGDHYEVKSIPILKEVSYKSGFLDGRIVQASLDGVFRKTHEIIIQGSADGNSFTKMSVSDQKMFNFIIKAMLSGRYLRIDYLKLMGPVAFPINIVQGYDTDYRIIGVEVLPELETPADRPLP